MSLEALYPVIMRDAETGEELQLPQQIILDLHRSMMLTSRPPSEEDTVQVNILRKSLQGRVLELAIPQPDLEKLEKDYLFSFLRNRAPVCNLQQQLRLLRATYARLDDSFSKAQFSKQKQLFLSLLENQALKGLVHSVHLQSLRLERQGTTSDELFGYWKQGTAALEKLTATHSSNDLALESVKELLETFDNEVKEYYPEIGGALFQLRRVIHETLVMRCLLNYLEAKILHCM